MFKNLKIRDKLFSAFGVALLLLMLCGGLFFVAINGMTNNFTTFHDEAFELSNETYALKAEITQLSNSICKSVMAPDTQSAEKYIDETEPWILGKDESKYGRLSEVLPTCGNTRFQKHSSQSSMSCRV